MLGQSRRKFSRTFFRAEIIFKIMFWTSDFDNCFSNFDAKKKYVPLKIAFAHDMVLCSKQNAVDWRSFENFRPIMSPGKKDGAKEDQRRPCRRDMGRSQSNNRTPLFDSSSEYGARGIVYVCAHPKLGRKLLTAIHIAIAHYWNPMLHDACSMLQPPCK